MVKAVTNATVLIFLAKIGKLDMLDPYCPLFTTSIVQKEVLGKDIQPKEKEDLLCFFNKKITIENPKKLLHLDLGPGETTALSLCAEQKMKLFLSDDKKARKRADFLGFHPLGTLGILLFHLQHKIITKKSFKC